MRWVKERPSCCWSAAANNCWWIAGSYGAVRTVYDDDGGTWALKSFESEEDEGLLEIGAIREISSVRR